MAPKSTEVPESSLGLKKVLPNFHLETNIQLSDWLKGKQTTDGAEGLWRVHDGLYNFEDFVQSHPGGTDWLEFTRGTDITEAFEVHHLSKMPEKMLEKYFIRKATQKRNSPFTFKDDGFYRTFKGEAQKILGTLPKQPRNNTAFFTDCLMVGTLTFSILAAAYMNYILGIVAGMFLGMVTIAAHNYLHQKDNFRMIYMNLSGLHYGDWRISHALSHHLFTNTVNDLEMITLHSAFKYFPTQKDKAVRLRMQLLSPIVWLFNLDINLIKKVMAIVRGQLEIDFYQAVVLILPIVMYAVSGQGLLSTLFMWHFILCVASFHFVAVGLNAAHHHPDIFHDGDTTRPEAEIDWGIGQLDAVMDRKDITGSHFLVLTNFGDHALHHMFPTLDHGTLELLYPTFNEVCKRFNVDLRMTSQIELIKGQFKQLARVDPNPNPPNLLKKY